MPGYMAAPITSIPVPQYPSQYIQPQPTQQPIQQPVLHLQQPVLHLQPIPSQPLQSNIPLAVPINDKISVYCPVCKR